MARRPRRSMAAEKPVNLKLAGAVIAASGIAAYYHAWLGSYIWEKLPTDKSWALSQLEKPLGYAVALVAGFIGLQVANVTIRSQFSQWRKRRVQRNMMQAARNAAHAARTLDELEWRDFEYLVGQIFVEKGYTAEVQEGSQDGGVDIVMRNRQGERLFVQCKHWKSTNVGAPTVREMAGTVLLNKADRGAIVCSGRYTKGAYKEAEELNIILIDGKQVMDYLGKL